MLHGPIDQVCHLAHLHARDTSFVAVSRAPFAKLAAYEERMGWTIPWFSSFESDFNVDFGVSPETPQPDVYQDGESFGLSVFLRDSHDVYRTYFTSGRGVEALGSVWSFLDVTPLGRQEVGGLTGRIRPDEALRVVAPPRRIRRRVIDCGESRRGARGRSGAREGLCGNVPAPSRIAEGFTAGLGDRDRVFELHEADTIVVELSLQGEHHPGSSRRSRCVAG